MPVSIMIFPLCELATGCRQFSFLLLLTFLLSCDIGICNPSVIRNQEIHLRAFNPDSLSDGIKDKALNKLMQVFGIRPPSHRERHLFPPQYMLDLYNSIADSSGITKTANPYDANVIRSFPNRDLYHHMHFLFNLSGVEANEKILQAEFHVYKTKPTSRPTVVSKPQADDVKSHLLEMRVYQVMDESRMNKEDGNRLLDARRVSSYSVGWEVFHVKTAVADWLKNHSTNYGLLVTFRSMSGEPVNNPLIRVAKRQHHGKKQPILVLFTDDGRPRQPPTFPTPDELAKWNLSQDDYNSDENGWENELHSTTKNSVHEKGISTQLINNARDKIVNNNNTSSITDLEGDQLISSVISTRNRERRSMSNDEDSSSEDYATSSEIQETSTYSDITNVQPDSDCSIHELYVDFEKIGWASWIISPKGYNASYCKGKCSFPLGQNQRPTNHATVQSIVHELRLHDGIEMPCCVPNKLFSISLLYFEGNGNVVLKQYEEMAAASCGCH